MIAVRAFEDMMPHPHYVMNIYHVSERIEVYHEGVALILSRLLNHLRLLNAFRSGGGHAAFACLILAHNTTMDDADALKLEPAFVSRLEADIGRLLSAYVAALAAVDSADGRVAIIAEHERILAQVANVPHYGFAEGHATSQHSVQTPQEAFELLARLRQEEASASD